MKWHIKITLVVLGLLLFFTGDRMNAFVIAQNNGMMPVINWNGKAGNPFALYQNATVDTRYYFLSDRQNWDGLSIGDVIMFLGIIPFASGLFPHEDDVIDKLNVTEQGDVK